jgi:hypothetical protein
MFTLTQYAEFRWPTPTIPDRDYKDGYIFIEGPGRPEDIFNGGRGLRKISLDNTTDLNTYWPAPDIKHPAHPQQVLTYPGYRPDGKLIDVELLVTGRGTCYENGVPKSAAPGSQVRCVCFDSAVEVYPFSEASITASSADIDGPGGNENLGMGGPVVPADIIDWLNSPEGDDYWLRGLTVPWRRSQVWWADQYPADAGRVRIEMGDSNWIRGVTADDFLRGSVVTEYVAVRFTFIASVPPDWYVTGTFGKSRSSTLGRQALAQQSFISV